MTESHFATVNMSKNRLSRIIWLPTELLAPILSQLDCVTVGNIYLAIKHSKSPASRDALLNSPMFNMALSILFRTVHVSLTDTVDRIEPWCKLGSCALLIQPPLSEDVCFSNYSKTGKYIGDAKIDHFAEDVDDFPIEDDDEEQSASRKRKQIKTNNHNKNSSRQNKKLKTNEPYKLKAMAIDLSSLYEILPYVTFIKKLVVTCGGSHINGAANIPTIASRFALLGLHDPKSAILTESPASLLPLQNCLPEAFANTFFDFVNNCVNCVSFNIPCVHAAKFLAGHIHKFKLRTVRVKSLTTYCDIAIIEKFASLENLHLFKHASELAMGARTNYSQTIESSSNLNKDDGPILSMPKLKFLKLSRCDLFRQYQNQVNISRFNFPVLEKLIISRYPYQVLASLFDKISAPKLRYIFLPKHNLSTHDLFNVLPGSSTKSTSSAALSASSSRDPKSRSQLFKKFPCLEAIRANGRGIKNFANWNFSEFENLRFLDIGNNGLLDFSGIDPRVHRGSLKNLEYLHLAHNSFSRLAFDSFKFPSLKLLDLTSNPLTKIENLRSVPNLETLILNRTRVKVIENLSHLRRLKVLHMEKCQLRELRIAEYLPGLEELDLSINGISELHASMEQVPNLIKLKISHNRLTKMESLASLSQLQVLEAAHNNIDSVDGAENLISLEYLDLSDNRYLQVVGDLSNLTKLQHLDLLKCAIARLGVRPTTRPLTSPAPANGGPVVGTPSPSSSSSVSYSYSTLPESITELDLHDNEISTLDALTGPVAHHVKALNVSSNPMTATNLAQIKQCASLKYLAAQGLYINEEEYMKFVIGVTNQCDKLRNVDVRNSVSGKEVIKTFNRECDETREFLNKVRVIKIDEGSLFKVC